MLFGDEYLVEKQIFSSNRAPNIAQKYAVGRLV